VLGTPGWALAVDAATFAVSAYFLLRLRAPGAARRGARLPRRAAPGWSEFAFGPGSGWKRAPRRAAPPAPAGAAGSRR